MKTQECMASTTYLICPVCHRGKIIAENCNADDIGIRLVPADNKLKSRWHVKCGVCKSQVGISIKR
jgi:hypothetical protein